MATGHHKPLFRSKEKNGYGSEKMRFPDQPQPDGPGPALGRPSPDGPGPATAGAGQALAGPTPRPILARPWAGPSQMG